MPHLKLTETTVAKIIPGSGDHHDKDLTGFHIRAGKRDLKYRVRVPIGKKVKVSTIGAVGDLSVDEARTKARIMMGQMLAEAPASTKLVKGEALTFGDALRAYLVRCAQQNRSEVTISGYTKLAERHLSDWYDVPLADLGHDRPRVEERFLSVGASSGPSSANAVFRVFRTVYNYAMKRYPTLPVNPSIVIEWHKDKPVKASYSPEELSDVVSRLMVEDRLQTRAHVHLLAFLTGCRGGALKGAKWEDYDRAGRRLRLPNHKGKPFTIRLSDALISFLDMRRQIVPKRNDFIFPAHTASGHVEDVRMKVPQSAKLAAYRKAQGIKEAQIGTHIWRDTYISVARAAGVSRDDTKRLCDHSVESDAHSGYQDDDAAHGYLAEQQERMSAYLLAQAGLGADYRFTLELVQAAELI
jgi:integrase